MMKMSSILRSNTLIGVTGFATSGKDTLYTICRNNLPSSFNTKRYAFADELKAECDKFLLDNVGISAFTSDPYEKEVIRPLLVTYGTHIRRKLDQNCWINRLEERIRSDALCDHLIFITIMLLKLNKINSLKILIIGRKTSLSALTIAKQNLFS